VTERARTVSTLVLCTVLAVAVVMIVLALPGLDTATEPTEVTLDFGTFVPGVEQVQTTVVDVPVPSRVREAGFAVATGFARDIDVTFELCQGTDCRPLEVDDMVAAGAYRLEVTALLDAVAEPGAEGHVAGRLLFAESSSTPPADRSQLVWLVTLGFIGVIALGVVMHRARAVTA
jgi:hypothetical protein